MALVKNAARNGAVCYHHDSKEIFVLLCLFLPQGLTLYWSSSPGLEYEKLQVHIIMKNSCCSHHERNACFRFLFPKSF